MSIKNKKIILKHLHDYFCEGESEKELIGLEVEKIGINKRGWTPPSYGGRNGYLAILGKLHDELGWHVTKKEGKYIMEMERAKTHLALESDGRIELAGSPHHSIHDLAREFRIHQQEIKEISDVFGVSWLGIGYHPFSLNKEIGGMPGLRRKRLLKYYQDFKKETGNDYGLAVYKKTAGIHVNIDYKSEEDFALKTRVAYRLMPVLNAIFANSPFSKKKFTGYMSYRRFIDSNTGLSRHTISQKFYESDYSYEDWIDEVISFPLLFIEREGDLICTNKSFRQYLEEGYENFVPTKKDFDNHMKCIWMGVRMRQVIEIRYFDSLPPILVPALAAFIKGIFYHHETLLTLKKMTDGWAYDDWKALEQDAARHGLQAKVQGRKLLHLAEDLLNMAEENLKNDRDVDINGYDESIHLAPIQNYIFVKGQSPAEWLVEQWLGKWNKSFFPVFEWYQY